MLWKLRPGGQAGVVLANGSMNSNNVESLLMIENIDGGLIGGASLSSEKLLPIIETSIKLST